MFSPVSSTQEGISDLIPGVTNFGGIEKAKDPMLLCRSVHSTASLVPSSSLA